MHGYVPNSWQPLNNITGIGIQLLVLISTYVYKKIQNTHFLGTSNVISSKAYVAKFDKLDEMLSTIPVLGTIILIIRLLCMY